MPLDRVLKDVTVASVTAAPKPVTVCLWPEEVSSILSCHVDSDPGLPVPWTGAVTDDRRRLPAEFEA